MPNEMMTKPRGMRRLFVAVGLLMSIFPLKGDEIFDEIVQNTNRAGGVYYAYPVTESSNSPAPEGYEPFYISHVGRHGSRYLLKESDYTSPLKTLRLGHEQGCLTEFGERIYAEVARLYDYAQYRAGDLTELGVTQHKDIATRMFKAYPQVFADSNLVEAHSTMVMRCAMSMAAFTEALKEHNPALRITRDPSERNARYMNSRNDAVDTYNSPDGLWQRQYKDFRKQHAPAGSFLPRIFSDSLFVKNNVNGVNFTCQMYNIAAGIQNIGHKADFSDLFTNEELFELWKIYNFRMYAHYSNYAPGKGVVPKGSAPLLRNIIDRADKAIAEKRTGADLRFGHDINIIPLAALMGIEGCDNSVGTPVEVWHVFQDYKISPMASNLQLIFFRNKDDDVLVKVMHNEREVALRCPADKFPFYRWSELKKYFESRM